MTNFMIRFYDARQAVKDGKPLTAIDYLIMSVSDPLVHCEAYFVKDNESFSASMRGERKGCGWADIQYSHPRRWIDIPFELTEPQLDRAYNRARDLDGAPYDTIGVASLKSGIIKENPDKYWCSEVCAELVKAALLLGDDFIPSTFSPNGLFFELYRRFMQ